MPALSLHDFVADLPPAERDRLEAAARRFEATEASGEVDALPVDAWILPGGVPLLVFAWPVDEVDTEDILHDVLLGAHEGVAALTPSPPADDRRTGQDRGTSFVAIPVPQPRPPRCEAARIPEHWEVSKDDRRLLPSRRRADRGRALCRSARQGRPFARHNAVVGLYWVPALLAGCLRSP